MEFNEKEAKVAKSLVKTTKSLNTLKQELEMEEQELKETLNKLVKLGVIREKDGRYTLIAKVRRGVMGKEEETKDLPFKVHAIMEGQSKDKKVLEKANRVLIENLKKDKLVKACNIVEEEIIKEDDFYYVLFEVDVYAKNFEDLLYFVLHYGPSSIELEKPDKFELGKVEAQGVLIDVASTIHSYMGVIHKMKKDREIVIK